MVCVSCAFVYNAVNINKIIIIPSTKPPSYSYAQVTTGLTLYLGGCANPWSPKFQPSVVSSFGIIALDSKTNIIDLYSNYIY